jgi:hypothetical protein
VTLRRTDAALFCNNDRLLKRRRAADLGTYLVRFLYQTYSGFPPCFLSAEACTKLTRFIGLPGGDATSQKALGGGKENKTRPSQTHSRFVRIQIGHMRTKSDSPFLLSALPSLPGTMSYKCETNREDVRVEMLGVGERNRLFGGGLRQRLFGRFDRARIRSGRQWSVLSVDRKVRLPL